MNSVGKESACNAGDSGLIPGQKDLLKKGQTTHASILGFPLWLSWQKICLQCGRPGFDPWVEKIP